jgi:hypothetical protein
MKCESLNVSAIIVSLPAAIPVLLDVTSYTIDSPGTLSSAIPSVVSALKSFSIGL